MFKNLPLPLALAASTHAVPASSNSAYQLIADWSGPDFFSHFTAYTGNDPTNGHVRYKDLDFAAKNNLVGYVYNASSNKTSAYIGVDHTNQAPNGRNSVRLISKDTFNAGSMVVIDTNHIPVGDGLWPAIWLLGSQGEWPKSGESDILEYVHTTDYNAMTLHTAPGCNVKSTPQLYQGHLENTNCNAGSPEVAATEGCSIQAKTQNTITGTNRKIATAGFDLNKQGGGVYVHDWQPDHITVWMFPHGGLPSDLVAGKPQPSTWKQKPLAKFAGDCDFSQALSAMQLIVNIDFCGDWAGKTWATDTGRNHTTCNDYVATNPRAFRDAYFDIASIRWYSNHGQKVVKRHEGHEEDEVPRRPLNDTGSGLPPHPLSNVSAPPPRHDCSGDNGSFHGKMHPIAKRSSIQTSDASSSSDSAEVSGWLAAAGMFVLIAYLI